VSLGARYFGATRHAQHCAGTVSLPAGPSFHELRQGRRVWPHQKYRWTAPAGTNRTPEELATLAKKTWKQQKAATTRIRSKQLIQLNQYPPQAGLAGKFFGNVRSASKGIFNPSKDPRKALRGLARNVLKRSVSVHGLKDPAFCQASFGKH